MTADALGAPVECVGVSCRHGASEIDSVDLSVAPREAVGLIGPSGCGRTLLLAVLATLVRPASGRATIGGVDLVGEPLEVRRRIGFVPRELPVQRRLTVGESLDLAAAARLPRGEKRRAAIDRALTWTGLPETTLVGRLPAGRRQLLLVASALIHEPSAVLLDEPLDRVDPLERHLVAERLQEARLAGAALVVSSGRIEDLGRLCSRILLMHRGRVFDTVDVAAAGDDLEGIVLRRLRAETSSSGRPDPARPETSR